MASGLLSLGLTQGERVAIWAPNYEFWYISMLAIARAGLLCVSLMNFTIEEIILKIFLGSAQSSVSTPRTRLQHQEGRRESDHHSGGFSQAKVPRPADDFDSQHEALEESHRRQYSEQFEARHRRV